MTPIALLKHKIVNDRLINRTEALSLIEQPLAELSAAADELRHQFCGPGFDLCTIVNAKSGRCPEDCAYCAQSAHHAVEEVAVYPLLSTEELVADAAKQAAAGVLRYSIVTSGKRLSRPEIDQLTHAIRAIREQVGIEVCVSLGLLDETDFRSLKAAGASRVHCNLETSERFFPEICQTHTYQEKIATLQAARRAGLSLCSGGIIGLGETWADRIDMLLQARELGIKSIPLNLLNPIAGTPLGQQTILQPEELRRLVAIARFIIPDATIRLAGGRGLLPDKGKACFEGGANAAISGDMLTTQGITPASDQAMIADMGFEVRLSHD